MKNILIICYLIMSTLLVAEEVIISYPKNKMSYHFYKNLKKDEYSGSYIDLLAEINKDKNYTFRYELAEKINNEDIQLRKTGGFSSKYYYLETPYTQKVFIIGNGNLNIEDLKNKEKIRLGCLGLEVDIVNEIKDSYDLENSETVIFFRNEVDAYYALQNDKVDALFILNFKQDNNFLGEILSVVNIREYIGVRKDKNELFQNLKKELNYLSKNSENILKLNIKNRENYFQYLYDDLSNYEKVKSKYDSIKVLVPNKDFLPYYKEKMFKKIGIVPYLMENIENFLGIPIEYVFSEEEEWDIKAVDFSQDNKTMSREYFRTKILGINHIYDSKITEYKQLENLKIINLKNTNIDVILKKINSRSIIEVDSLEEAFKLLKENKGDIILGPYYLLNHYFLSHNYGKYFKTSQSKFDLVAEMTFKDEELKNLLKNLLLSYSADEIEFITNKVIDIDKPINFGIILINIFIGIFTLGTIVWLQKYIVKQRLKKFIALFIKIEDINRFKDNRSILHAKNVSIISRLIAQELKFRKSQINKVEKLGLIHDIGLIFIPKDIILKKKTKTLSEKEKRIFKEHTNLGNLLLKGIGIGIKKRKIIKYHHENLDGSGYFGIIGKNIPIESKIIRVADMYDRIVSWNNNSHEEALNFLEKYKNVFFDPIVVDAIFKLQIEIKSIYQLEINENTEIVLKEFEKILEKQ